MLLQQQTKIQRIKIPSLNPPFFAGNQPGTTSRPSKTAAVNPNISNKELDRNSKELTKFYLLLVSDYNSPAMERTIPCHSVHSISRAKLGPMLLLAVAKWMWTWTWTWTWTWRLVLGLVTFHRCSPLKEHMTSVVAVVSAVLSNIPKSKKAIFHGV